MRIFLLSLLIILPIGGYTHEIDWESFDYEYRDEFKVLVAICLHSEAESIATIACSKVIEQLYASVEADLGPVD